MRHLNVYPRKRFGLAAIFIVLASIGSAQTIPSIGRDFYLAYPYPSFKNEIFSHSAGFYSVSAFVTSYTAATVYVSYFDSLSGLESTPLSYYVSARKTIQIPLDLTKMTLNSPGDRKAELKSVHIYSKSPISVSYFSYGPCGGGSYLALPVAMYGTKYVVASQSDNPDGEGGIVDVSGPGTPDAACGFFIVIGAYNSTVVKITPTSTTQGGNHPGVHNGQGANGTPQPYTITLDRGQCYLVKSWCESNDNDISGSTIESDKPVAVISGHENSGIGDVSAYTIEGRDLLTEQMIPVEYWDNTGYVSFPFVDSSPAIDEGSGDNYRVYTFDEGIANVQLQQSSISGTIDMSVGKFGTHERIGVVDPVNFYSSDGKKFSVFQYDIAAQSANLPYPRPSMMTIVPISAWGRSYGWYVPTTQFGAAVQRFYVNIIAEYGVDGIEISVNGGPDKYIGQSGLVTSGSYTIPGHSELQCRRYRVYPGSYYVHSDYPFIAYIYGNDGVDFDNDLPEVDPESYYFSCANPCGYTASAGKPSNMKVDYDSTCSSWHVYLTDIKAGSKIKSVALINDPASEIFPNGGVSTNCHFDPVSDPLQLGEIALPARDSLFDFTVLKTDAALATDARIYIVTTTGWKMLHLSSPKAAKEIATGGRLEVASAKRGIPIDTTIFFVNTSNTDHYSVTDISFAKADTNVTVVSVKPPLPAELRQHDTLYVSLRFTLYDTAKSSNYIYLNKDCLLASKEFTMKYLTGMIDAGDHNFGKIEIGKESCFPALAVRNVGDAPFTLTKNFTITNSAEFYLDPSSLAKLPVDIAPGDSVAVTVCYQPHYTLTDTATISWVTTISAPYTQSVKSFSRLYGSGSQQQSIVQDGVDVASLSITPMPVRDDEAHLHFTLVKPSHVSVTLLDLLGREVAPARTGSFGEGEREVRLSLKGLSAGFYYVRFETKTGVKMIKMQVVR
jgi:hypothetical protein